MPSRAKSSMFTINSSGSSSTSVFYELTRISRGLALDFQTVIFSALREKVNRAFVLLTTNGREMKRRQPAVSISTNRMEMKLTLKRVELFTTTITMHRTVPGIKRQSTKEIIYGLMSTYSVRANFLE